MIQSQTEVATLNVGAGDTKLSFDKSNPKERERAAGIVADMLRRGYAIMIQVGEKNGEPLYQRAHGFDPETCEYIIAGGPDETIDIGTEVVAAEAPPPRSRQKRASDKRIPAEKTRAVSVGRSAGG